MLVAYLPATHVPETNMCRILSQKTDQQLSVRKKLRAVAVKADAIQSLESELRDDD